LCKGKLIPDSRGHQGLAHSIEVKKKKYSIGLGKTIDIPLRVENTGDAIWLVENYQDIGVVKIGTHLYDNQDRLLELDFTRHALPKQMIPEDFFSTEISLKFQSVGVYKLSVDLVSEGICWFENVGSEPQYLELIVS